MKKLLSFVLIITFVLSLAACASVETGGDDKDKTYSTSSPKDTNVSDTNDGTETEPEAETEPPIVDAAGREEEIYEKWLLDGNYDKLLEGSKMQAKGNKTYAHLEDLNGDGVRDLYFTSTNGAGIMTYIITIYDGRVSCAGAKNYNYREKFEIKTDTQTGKLVVTADGYSSQTASSPYSERSFVVYDFVGGTLTPRTTVCRYNLDPSVSGADELAKMQSETEYYTRTGSNYFWWKIDGRYVSDDEYVAALERYESYETDMTLGSYSDVLALKKKAEKKEK